MTLLEEAPAVDRRQYSAVTENAQFFSDCNYYLIYSCFLFLSSVPLPSFLIMFLFLRLLFCAKISKVIL